MPVRIRLHHSHNASTRANAMPQPCKVPAQRVQINLRPTSMPKAHGQPLRIRSIEFKRRSFTGVRYGHAEVRPYQEKPLANMLCRDTFLHQMKTALAITTLAAASLFAADWFLNWRFQPMVDGFFPSAKKASAALLTRTATRCCTNGRRTPIGCTRWRWGRRGNWQPAIGAAT